MLYKVNESVFRMSYRRQKRWWNAYILFYERIEPQDEENQISKRLQDLTGRFTPNVSLEM